ncbi:MAG: SH3 domain-containing protein [Caldilineaceae bacterium]|nr:SH3 domain-containing protein [Caldilineaceae bacterium]
MLDRIKSLEHRVQVLEQQVSLLSTTLETDLVPLPTLEPLPTIALPPTNTPEPTMTDSSNNVVLVVHVERGNIRSGPGTNYNIIGTVRKDQIIRGSFDKQDGWYRFCCLDGQPGWVAGSLVTELTISSSTSVTRPPESLGAAPFYRKYLNVGGVPVLADGAVSDDVLFRTRDTITAMLQNRPDLLYTMSVSGFRVGLFKPTKGDITQLPEFDNRFKHREGAFISTPYGAMAGTPSTVQHCNRVLIHEFAHAVYHAILRQPEGKHFKDRWSEAYRDAMTSGRWQDEYASTNESEYWAETVTFWLMPEAFRNAFGIPFAQYDPTANQLIWQVFGHTSLPDFCKFSFVSIRGTIAHADGTPVEGIYVIPTLWIRLDGEARYIGTADVRQKIVPTDENGAFIISQAIDKGVAESQGYFLLGFYKERIPTRTPVCSIAGWLHRQNYVTKSWGSTVIPATREKPVEITITVRKDFDWSPLDICH